MSPSLRKRSLAAALIAVTAATVTAPRPTAACGPNFPNRLLLSPDEVLLSGPVADFARELARLVPAPAKPFEVVGVYDGGAQTRTVEADDLDRALVAAGATPEVRAAAVAKLAQARKDADPRALDGLTPADLREYARGAILYRAGKIGEARAVWRALLDLPPAERPRRSVWAAYMLGRSYGAKGELRGGDDQPELAAEWFAKTRELAAAGFADRLGLAATSLGWEAALRLDQGRTEDAVGAYLAQAAHGDASGVNSLAVVSERVLADPAQLPGAAGSSVLRPVLTALLLARSSYAYVPPDGDASTPDRTLAGAWLDALEAAKVGAVPGADRLAWLAYRLGRYPVAERWLAVAPPGSVVTLWTRAKLALRAGDVKAAAKLLAQVASGFAETERWQYWPGDWGAWGAWDMEVQPAGRARAELALLELSSGELVRACDLLLRSEYNLDAAYLAERVITVDELKTLVDARWPAPSEPDAVEPGGAPSAQGSPVVLYSGRRFDVEIRARAVWVRYLLGRRLARARRFDEARAYLPAAQAAVLDRYRAAIASARDRARPDADRAASWWEAAKIARHDGMELMGTEGAPDWQIYSGNFSLAATLDGRTALKSELAPAAPRELTRAKELAPIPDRRFHYRYVAGDHVMNAVKLLPRDSAAAGVMLCHAAAWVINRDPPAARRFYEEYQRRGRYIPSIPDFGGSCPAEP
ncbi:MAG: hypothetical protein CVU56_13140 [Deltaproteobacteria bacterium HGW-Deltaproteobacteria-14]|nr:MAG: hypothetical protein CVU56_13140 [Deltaproteobacteria bacterium HGW-Deltaproteobacteria-14]